MRHSAVPLYPDANPGGSTMELACGSIIKHNLHKVVQAVSGHGRDDQPGAGRCGVHGDAAAGAGSGAQQSAAASTLADGMKPAASAQCDEVRCRTRG